MNFVAIDFETANSDRASACALGIANISDGKVITQEYHLIHPPRLEFNPYNVAVHGITKSDVIDKPNFYELWPYIRHYFDNSIIIAHNASFDISVLRYCLDYYDIPYPNFKYGCTMIMSRKQWPDFTCHKLDAIAATLDINFNHHHALNDALACAQIALQIINDCQAETFDALSSILGFSLGHLYPGGYKPASNLKKTDSSNVSKKSSTGQKKYSSKSEIDKSLHVLEGIIAGIAIDEKINIYEIRELEGWFKYNQHLLKRPPFSDIVNLLDEAFADGIFTAEEKADIIWACNNHASNNIYHDFITHNVQKLHGILHGILADNKINLLELKKLDEWLTDNDYLTGIYPYDELCSLLVSILKDGHLDDNEMALLKVFFSDYVDLKASSNLDEQEIKELKRTIKLPGICAVCPEIIIPGNLFCFTGQSSSGSRKDISSLIESMGGRYKDTVTRDTSYLIVGNEGNPCWAFSCYGRKVEKAMNMRKTGNKIMIIHENDFWDEVG